jgi:hypothetical protein
MRRDKTVARILLIFSVVDAVLAAPAAVRQGHLGVAEDVAAASVKRGEPNLTPSTSGEPPQLPPPGPVGSVPEALGNKLDLTPSAPSTSSAGKAPQLPPSGAEAQEDKHLTSSASSLELEDPEFEAMMMRMKASANPWGASDTSSEHSSWSYDSALDKDVQSLPSTRYGTPPTSPRPPMNVKWPEQVVSSYHDAPDTASEASYEGSEASHEGSEASHEGSEASHEGSEAAHEVSPASPPMLPHENAAPTSSPHQGTPPNSPSGPSHQDSAPESPAKAPEPNKFLSEGLKENAKVVAAAGAVFGAYIGGLQGVKVIKDKISSRAYVSPLFPPSCRQLTESKTF